MLGAAVLLDGAALLAGVWLAWLFMSGVVPAEEAGAALELAALDAPALSQLLATIFTSETLKVWSEFCVPVTCTCCPTWEARSLLPLRL